jgi:hypothetical protein
MFDGMGHDPPASRPPEFIDLIATDASDIAV